MFTRHPISGLPLAALLAGLPAQVPAAHASNYAVGVGEYSSTTGDCVAFVPPDDSGPEGASASLVLSGPDSGGFTGGGSVSVFANGGEVSGLVECNIAAGENSPVGLSELIGGCLHAELLLDDVVITGPTPTVSTRLFVHVEGTASSMHNDAGGATLDGLVQAFFFQSSQSDITLGTSDFTLATPLVTVNTGEPLRGLEISLSLEGTVGASHNSFGEIGSASVTLDFSNTVSFPKDGPVFDLPPGYTANSADGHIVDNQYLPPADCPADLDGDGAVGTTDFLGLLAAWGPNPGHPADLDDDGTVGTTDFLELLANWGPCP